MVRLSQMNNKERKEFLLSLTRQQRKKLLHELVIYYPQFKENLERIRSCHEQFGYTSEPDCLFIAGDTGAGKSTLKDAYTKDFPRTKTDEGAHIPVFSSSIPCHPTVKGVVSKLLYDLGDPNYEKGTEVGQTTSRLWLE